MFDEWTTHHSELSRKTGEKFLQIADLHKAKRLTDRDALVAVNVLYDTTAGLIDKELSDGIALFHKEIRGNIQKALRDVPFET